MNDSIQRGGNSDVFEMQLMRELPELNQSLSVKEYQVLKEFYVKMETF